MAFDVPDDRIMYRYGNNAIFYPLPDDPSWETGPNYILAPESDPILGQMYIQFKEDGTVDFYFVYATSTLYTIVYNESQPIDAVVTDNATIPDRRLLEMPSPVRVVPRHLARRAAFDTTHRELACGSQPTPTDLALESLIGFVCLGCGIGLRFPATAGPCAIVLFGCASLGECSSRSIYKSINCFLTLFVRSFVG